MKKENKSTVKKTEEKKTTKKNVKGKTTKTTTKKVEKKTTAKKVEEVVVIEKKEEKVSKLNYGLLSKYRGLLMGISVITVLVLHLGMYRNMQHHGYTRFWQLFCRYVSSSGVDVFLLVSGIGLYFAFKKNSNLKDFYIKRYTKIFVPYLTICVVAALIRFFVLNVPNNVVDLILNLSFANAFFDGEGWFWYIFAISAFYLMFPAIYHYFDVEDDGVRVTRLLTLTSFVLIILEMLFSHSHRIFMNLDKFFMRIPVFILGVYLGKKVYNKDKIKVRDIIIMVLNLLLVFVIHKSSGNIIVRPLFAIINISLLFLGIIILDYVRDIKIFSKLCSIFVKVLEFIGKYSLEMYLIHVALLNIGANADLKMSRYSYYGTMVIITFILSLIYQKLNNKIIEVISPKITKLVSKFDK